MGHQLGAATPSEPMSLFQKGNFQLASGAVSTFKIECDALTDEDLECIAYLLFQRIPHEFAEVVGVPTGGVRLAKAMEKYITPGYSPTLIVDDVFTTGGSFDRFIKEKGYDKMRYMAAVIFARHEPPEWITPLFIMS